MKRAITKQMAIDAIKDRDRKFKLENISFLKSVFPELLDKFPGLTWDENSEHFNLLGYRFRPYPVGINIQTGKSSYALDPEIHKGYWVYDLASLGDFILWAESSEYREKFN